MPAKQELVLLKIEDATPSADWCALWQRLLAPPPDEVAREAPTSVLVNVAHDSVIESYIAAQLETEAR